MIRNVWKLTLGLLTAAVVGAGADARAAFSVMISANELSTPLTFGSGLGPNAGAFTFSGNTSVFLAGPPPAASFIGVMNGSTNAIQNSGAGTASLVSSLTLFNQVGISPGIPLTNVVVTIIQDAYSFTSAQPGLLSTTFTASQSVSHFASTDVLSGPSSTATLMGTSGSNSITVNPAGNPREIMQTFTFASLPVNSTLTLTTTSTLGPVTAVPVPATALAALAALPVFGLGLRRRKTAAV